MWLSRQFILSVTMVVAIAWIGLSVGASFHHHHGHHHDSAGHDCPWCSLANSQLIPAENYLASGVSAATPSWSFILADNSFISCDLLAMQAPRAPPVS